MKRILVMGLMFLSSGSVMSQVCNQNSIREMSYFMSVYNANVSKCVVGPAGPACKAICDATGSMPSKVFSSSYQEPSLPVDCPQIQPVRCPDPQPSRIVERCNQSEIDRVFRSAQEDTIRRLKKDLMIEGRVSARGFLQVLRMSV